MFQDILPHRLNNQYTPREAREDDYFIILNGERVLFDTRDGGTALPHCGMMKDAKLTYLLSVDDTAFYLCRERVPETETLKYQVMHALRASGPEWMSFAGATAIHIAHWYDTHKLCGRCGDDLEHKEDERALCCPNCGNIIYPTISPVVIVGVTDGDRLLLTKYAAGMYNRHALIAGFMEIGETFEDTIRREVMEEVGLEVTNMRYYKSQPWAFSHSLLAGFFADVSGSKQAHADGIELSEAEWFERSDLPKEDSTFSLTWDMIEAFRQGKV